MHRLEGVIIKFRIARDLSLSQLTSCNPFIFANSSAILSVTFCLYVTNEALTLLPCGRPKVLYFAKFSEDEALHN